MITIKKDMYSNIVVNIVERDVGVSFAKSPKSGQVQDSTSVDFKFYGGNLVRAKTLFREYALNNVWNFFGTFTIRAVYDGTNDVYKPNSDGIGLRYDPLRGLSEILRLFSEFKRKLPSFRYLMIPELHNDNAIHFHALLFVDITQLHKSWTPNDSLGLGSFKDKGQDFMSLSYFYYNLGINTLRLIAPTASDHLKVVNYLCNYMTQTNKSAKNVNKVGLTKIGKSYIYHSRGLNKSSSIVFDVNNKHDFKRWYSLVFSDSYGLTENHVIAGRYVGQSIYLNNDRTGRSDVHNNLREFLNLDILAFEKNIVRYSVKENENPFVDFCNVSRVKSNKLIKGGICYEPSKFRM